MKNTFVLGSTTNMFTNLNKKIENDLQFKEIDSIKRNMRPNLKNLSRGLNLSRGSNMVGST